MSGGGWSCPHQADGRCSKVNGVRCDPGMKGCELYGRYAFFDDSKNARLKEKQARAAKPDGEAPARSTTTEQNKE